MSTTRRSIMVVTALALALPSVGEAKRRDGYHRDHRHDRHRDRDRNNGGAVAGAAIGVAILGIAAAAAAAKRKREERREYREGYRDGYQSSGYAPARGVVCFREERRCYAGGHFSYEWTDNQFSYDPYRRGY